MNIDGVLSRIGRSEFFAIMAPGLHILAMVVLSAATVATHGRPEVLLLDGSELRDDDPTFWLLAIASVFVSYLLGCIPRAFPVNLADRVSGRILKLRPWKNDFAEKLAKERFPYVELLNERMRSLGIQGDAIGDGKSDFFAHTSYNYWKLRICKDSPALFMYTQQFESRVRLFAGMFWAGCCGLFLALVSGILVHSDPAFDHAASILAGPFLVSGIFAALFGYRLRFMREEEASHVFVGYLVVSGLANATPALFCNPPATCSAGDDMGSNQLHKITPSPGEDTGVDVVARAPRKVRKNPQRPRKRA